jgi:hypothetical protein
MDAVVLARQHGLYQTARALRVDYSALKRHVETTDAPGRAHVTSPFVELAAPTPMEVGACVIELTGPRATVRLRVPGLDVAAIARLSQRLAGIDA